MQFVYFEPRQINDIGYLSDFLRAQFDNHGVKLILYSVGWEDYQSYPYAGSMGYFMYGGGSARAYGQARRYSENNFARAITWTDKITPDRCSGWVGI